MNALRKWLPLTLALAFVLIAGAAHADLYWENENVSQGIPQQRDGATLMKNYFTDTAARIEPGDGKVMIMDYSTMTLYSLNPREKSYDVIDLSQPIPMPSKMSGADKEAMSKMMGQMMQIKVTPTPEKKVIEGYNCQKYMVDMTMVKGVYWVSKDVKGYPELRKIGTRLAAMSEKNPMLRQMNVAAMVEKLDGFPVQTVNNVMGGTLTSTLKRIEQRPLDPGLFKVPKDYARKEK